jgi:hypothetical protein
VADIRTRQQAQREQTVRKIVNVSEREKFLGPEDCEHHLTHSLADMVVRRRGEDDDGGKTQQLRGEEDSGIFRGQPDLDVNSERVSFLAEQSDY